MRRFVLVTHGRSGAAPLMRALRSRPEILLHSEVFHQHWSERKDLDGAGFLRDQVYVDDGAHAAVGFRLNYFSARRGPQATAWAWLESLEDLVVVHAVRDDLLASFVETQVAHHTQRWGLPVEGEEPPPPPQPLRIDPEKLTRFFTEITAARQEVSRRFARQRPMEIEHIRNVATNLQTTCDALVRRLGLPPRPLEPRLRKRNSFAVEPWVSNWDELELAFQDTPWAAMIRRG